MALVTIRSDAGNSIVQEVFAFVKETCPERSGGGKLLAEREVGKGAAALVPASALKRPDREALRSNILRHYGAYRDLF